MVASNTQPCHGLSADPVFPGMGKASPPLLIQRAYSVGFMPPEIGSYGVLALGGRLWNFLAGLLPCGLSPDLG